MTHSRMKYAALAALALFAVLRAANTRYQAQYKQMREAAVAEQKKLGLVAESSRKELFAKFPTPQITLVKIAAAAPGGTVDVAVGGKIPAGTRFLCYDDEVEVVKEAATATEYRATLRVAPNAPFGFVNMDAFTPVSMGRIRRAVAFVGARHNWDLKASNGWRIALKMTSAGFQLKSENAEATYQAEFYRQNEAKPFETRSARVSLHSSSNMSNSLSISLTGGDEGMDELTALAAKMQNPQVMNNPEEVQKLIARMEQLQAAQAKRVQAMLADPAAVQRKEDEFGCHNISINYSGAAAKGNMGCGKKVGRLELTGAMALAK
jgi:hypothetical protein